MVHKVSCSFSCDFCLFVPLVPDIRLLQVTHFGSELLTRMKRITEPPVAPTKTKKLRIFCGTQSTTESCARKITTEVSDTFLPSLQTASEELDGLSDPATQRIHDNFLIASKPFLDVREHQETVINKFCKLKILMVEHQTRELEKFCDKQYDVWVHDYFILCIVFSPLLTISNLWLHLRRSSWRESLKSKRSMQRR